MRMNGAIRKLMETIGMPDWYQSITTNWTNNLPTIILTMNKMINPAEIKRTVPRDVDGIPIKIMFKSPASRFYGKDGPSCIK